jgi:hypothetical protein
VIYREVGNLVVAAQSAALDAEQPLALCGPCTT